MPEAKSKIFNEFIDKNEALQFQPQTEGSTKSKVTKDIDAAKKVEYFTVNKRTEVFKNQRFLYSCVEKMATPGGPGYLSESNLSELL